MRAARRPIWPAGKEGGDRYDGTAEGGSAAITERPAHLQKLSRGEGGIFRPELYAPEEG